MRSTLKLALALVVAPCTLVATASAQQVDEPRPDAVNVAEVFAQIETEMKQIDRLLLRCARRGRHARHGELADAAGGEARVVQAVDRLLERATDTQARVVTRIDDLIKRLRKRGRSKGGGSGN